MSASTSISARDRQKFFERVNKTHTKILIGAKGGKSRRSSRRKPAQRQQRPQRQQRQRQRQPLKNPTTEKNREEQHRQRTSRILNDRSLTLAQRKKLLDDENASHRQRQQQTTQRQEAQANTSNERVRRNARDAKYTSRYLDQRRPRRYLRRRSDGTTVIVGGGGVAPYGATPYGGIPAYSGGISPYAGGAPLYGGTAPYGAVPYGSGVSPYGETPYGETPNNSIPSYLPGGQAIDGDDDDGDNASSSSSTLIDYDGEAQTRILNVSTLRKQRRQTHMETSGGELRVIPALEGVDVDVINRFLQLRDAFDNAETYDERVQASIQFVVFTEKIDRIFKTHAQVYVRAMKYRPSNMEVRDVEANIDSLSPVDVEQLSLLSNTDLRDYLQTGQMKINSE